MDNSNMIDPNISLRDMMTIIKAEMDQKGIAGHHIDSMNSFYQIGINQIATKIFVVDGRLKNERNGDDEDREIAEILYHVDFTNIELTKPTTNKFLSGTSVMLTPNMARKKNLTYSSRLYIWANITATAIYKNGSTKVRKEELVKHCIGSIPCMVGSVLCNTNGLTNQSKKEIEEDPRDPGGYFIIKGTEWIVDSLENLTNNNFNVFKNGYSNEIARGVFLSKPGDTFENSYQVVMRYLNNGAITIEITTNKKDKIDVPFYLFFRAVGITGDADIVNHIIYGLDNDDPVSKEMKEILYKAFTLNDPKFGPIKDSTDQAEIIDFIGKKIAEGANLAQAAKDENMTKHINSKILNVIDNYIFPHIGNTTDVRVTKMRFIGHLINKLLRVYMEVSEATDRDSYRNKRILAAGTTIAKSFKTHFNFAVVQEIKKRLNRDFKSTPFSSVRLAECVRDAIKSDKLEQLLTKSITNGGGTLTMGRNEITNRVSSQQLYHKNDINVMSTLNNINTPNPTVSKQNERADQMRRVHPTMLGYADPTQSPDTGEGVGRNKQMACTASICAASSSYIIRSILSNDTSIILLDKVRPEDITQMKLSKVFVNGYWLGCCKASHELARKYRMMRREGKLVHTTTIFWNPLEREINFLTDVGRLIRPLVIVYNNYDEYVENWRNGDKTVKFKQWIKLTKEHIKLLRTHKLTMEDLMKQQVIEYISSEEQENCYLADNLDTLRRHSNDIQHMYTHCDIEQAMFGVIVLTSPMANHSNTTRITYYTNHRKQSAGWFSLNYPFRIDKGVTLQHYCERPLISTFGDTYSLPYGHNVVVALMLHGGQNQEDSLVVNKASIHRGMFNASQYNYERTELDKNETFGQANSATTMDIKQDAVYEHCGSDGFVKPGTTLKKNTVMMVKSLKLTKPIKSYTHADRSVIYKKEEHAYVDYVVDTRNNSDIRMAKVKYHADRMLNFGDKMSSRTGNKGIVSLVEQGCNMPYTEDGIYVDIIANAHSIPTRMAVNQIIECVLGQIAVKECGYSDATTFTNINTEEVISKLESVGIKYSGHKRVYNGMTGEWVDSLIFLGPTTYQRLEKFVVDSQYASYSGPTQPLTHQPVEGKNAGGGLRTGEMESWVYCAHGSMRSLGEKFYDHSDGSMIPICRVCKQIAIINDKLDMYKCKRCGPSADIVKVNSSRAATVFFNEVSTMNIDMKFELDPFTYSKNM